jgi:hypothetical protein
MRLWQGVQLCSHLGRDLTFGSNAPHALKVGPKILDGLMANARIVIRRLGQDTFQFISPLLIA